jgi:hypothetical protein
MFLDYVTAHPFRDCPIQQSANHLATERIDNEARQSEHWCQCQDPSTRLAVLLLTKLLVNTFFRIASFALCARVSSPLCFQTLVTYVLPSE